MFNRIRVSTDYAGYESWSNDDGKWKIKEQNNVNDCKSSCIANNKCKIWKFNHKTSECNHSMSEAIDREVVDYEVSCGIVKLETIYDRKRVVGIILAILSILVVWNIIIKYKK